MYVIHNVVTVQDQGAAHTVPAAEVSGHTTKEAIFKYVYVYVQAHI